MKLYTLTIFVLISMISLGQEKYIVVNHDSISISQFRTDYKNNIQAEGWDKAIDDYIDFTLIQQAAEMTALDTTASFQKAFKQSFEPIKEKYLIDYQIEDELKKEIWANLQTDRKVEIYAIGIQNKFNKNQVREREQLVNELHQHVCGKKTASASVLGYLEGTQLRQLWMRPFTIPAEIEKVIYRTDVGECSAIQASDNGNFFVKILEERPSTGIIYLRYIFNKDKQKAEQAYQLLSKDSAWIDVKRDFNQYESDRGYQNKPVYEADIPQELLEVVQDMKGKYSAPVALHNGYYIINLRKHKKFDDYAQWEDWITSKIKETDYALDYVKKTEQRAVETVIVKENKLALEEVVHAMGNDFFENDKEIILDSDEAIWSTEDDAFTQQQFLKEMSIAQSYFDQNTDTKSFLAYIVPKFKTQFKLNNYVKNMELYEPKLAEDALILKKSILIDYYLDREIYDKAKKDTIGLQKYLTNHTQEFSYPKRYAMDMYRFKDDADGKRIERMLKEGKSKEEILQKFNNKKSANGALKVVAQHGYYDADSNEFDKTFSHKKKVQITKYRGIDVVIKLNDIIAPRSKTIEEAGHQLKEAYSEYYYNQTLNKLRNNATISIPDTL